MTLCDFDRPLNKRGKRDAPLMGSILKNKNITPDMIISSPALRAKTTADIIAKEVNYRKEIIFVKSIYEASPTKLHKILRKTDDKICTLFLFGHNPGLNILAEDYVGFYGNIVTCGIVEIEFSCDRWAEISSKNARLISFDYPKRHDLT